MIPPPGEDPDSVARKFGRDKIDELAYDALGFIPFRIRKVNLEESGIIAKEKLVKELSALAEKITDPTRRALFYAEASSALSIDQSIFQNSVPSGRVEAQNLAFRHSKRQKIEMEFLSLLFCNPGCLDEAFEAISADDLDSKQLSRLYSAMIQQYQKIGLIQADKLIENFVDETGISLATEVASIEWEPEVVEGETRKYIQLMAERKRRRIRADLQKEMAKAEADGDQERASALLEQIKSFGL
jgi:DNA primase